MTCGCDSSEDKTPVESFQHVRLETKNIVHQSMQRAEEGYSVLHDLLLGVGVSENNASEFRRNFAMLNKQHGNADIISISEIWPEASSQQRAALKELLEIPAKATSPEQLSIMIAEFDTRYYNISRNDSDIVFLYSAIIKGINDAYISVNDRFTATAMLAVPQNEYMHIRLVQSIPDDGRYNPPPTFIDYSDFWGGVVLAGLAGGAIGAPIGGLACSPSTLFTLGLGPAGCAGLGGAIGFIGGGAFYAGAVLGGASRDYKRALDTWCYTQSLFSLQHPEYEDLCDGDKSRN